MGLREDMALGPVDADGDLGAGGAEFLEEAAVSADPQVVLGYLHCTEVAGAWCSIKAQEQPGDGDHVVLHEGLWGSRAM